MKRSASSTLPKLAAGLLLGVSCSAFAGGMPYQSEEFSRDQGYSLDQHAADLAAIGTTSGMEAGQAGRAGPETVPMTGAAAADTVAWPTELRYSVYHLAAELDAAKASMSSGQAGPTGPEALPGAMSEPEEKGRFRIDDRAGGSFW